MPLEGPKIKNQSINFGRGQAVLTISKLIMYNSVKYGKDDKHSGVVRYSLECEILLQRYIRLSIHTWTRKNDLISILFELGVSVPYDRVMQVLTYVANRVCLRFEVDKVVCPSPWAFHC